MKKKNVLLGFITILVCSILIGCDTGDSTQNNYSSKNSAQSKTETIIETNSDEIAGSLETVSSTKSTTKTTAAASTKETTKSSVAVETTKTATAVAPATEPTKATEKQMSYVLNTKTMKFHKTSCSKLPTTNRSDFYGTRSEVINNGYNPCQICKP